MARPVVVIALRWTPRAETAIRELYEVRQAEDEAGMSADQIVAAAEGAAVVCPGATQRFDGDLIARLPASVGLLASFGAGVNHIDLGAARARGLYVSNTPDVVTEDTADLSFGLIIATCRRFAEGDALVRRGGFKGLHVNFMLGMRVWDKTLGIVGMGRIGQAVARRARAAGMRILYHNRNRDADAERALAATYCADLDQMLAQADIVSIHCPLNEATHHLFDAARIAHMKPAGVLINASRGPIVAEAALVAALREGRLAAAGLDVYEFEPKVAAALRTLDNTVLLPHLGTATHEARDAMGLRVLDNVRAFLETGRPIDVVAAP